MDYQLGPGPLQVDQNTIDEKIKGDIGIVENGDVATHAITSGYYVIWKGDLYVAKTDISSGTTLSAASNGNLTAKTNGLGAEIAALNSKITYTAGNATLEVYGGHLCVLQMNNVQITSEAVIIPQQFRPSYTIWAAVGVTEDIQINNNYVSSIARAAVEPTGSVLIQINGSNHNANVRGQIVWVI